jgi:hypothetical protein
MARTKVYKNAMDSVLNQTLRPLSSLSDYLDRLLQQKTVLAGEDLETHIARVIALFRFLRQKGAHCLFVCMAD